MPCANDNLAAAYWNRDDEFYTSRKDIEAEIGSYPAYFKGKAVHCNCDDPELSEFWAYFRDNFAKLGLARLTATGLATRTATRRRPTGRVMDAKGERKLDLSSGSFAGAEAVAITRDSDVVVTNPPFSMIRPFLSMLADTDVDYLFLGPINSLGYRAFFPHILKGRLRTGATGRATEFRRPDGSRDKLGNILWFTNIAHGVHHKPLKLTALYDPERFPGYSNADAINVDKAADIPKDYGGPMGVPVSFLERLNPDQFDIVGFCSAPLLPVAGQADERKVFRRVLIRNRALKKPPPRKRDLFSQGAA